MSDDEKIFLGHTTGVIRASITRPADGAVYAAGDVIGTVAGAGSVSVLDFVNVARSAAGAGMINGCACVDSANQATPPSLELWLFTVAPANQQDNAPFAVTDAELANLVGIIPLTTFRIGNTTVGAGGNGVLQADTTMLSFRCAAGVEDLYGVLVVRNAYTPVASEVFSLILTALQDY